MEAVLKKAVYRRLEPVWQEMFSGEFQTDCIVPDTLPDVRDVVDGEGILQLRSKNTEDGCLVITAVIQSSVLYVPDAGGELRNLSAAIPVDIRIEDPAIVSDCRAVCRLRIKSMEPKMVNSRKISVRAEVCGDLCCYREDSPSIAVGLEQNDPAVHILKNTASSIHVTDVREKAFVITDQYSVQGDTSAGMEILSQRAEVYTEDVKFVSGKVIFRGRVSAILLVVGGDGGAPVSMRYDTEFSQIMEVDADVDDIPPEVSLLLTGVYLDLPERGDTGGKIGAEYHMAAQCVCREKKEVSYVEDIYSNKAVFRPVRKGAKYVSEIQAVSMRQTVTGRAESCSGEIIYASAAVGGISMENATVKTVVNTRLLCRKEGGEYALARCRLNAEFTTDIPAGTELKEINVRVTDVYYSPAAGAADVRVVLQMDGVRVTSRTVTCVECVEVEEGEAFPAAPSMTLVRKGDGADLWGLAKKYRSSPEAISAANEGNNGRLLLIPKSR